VRCSKNERKPYTFNGYWFWIANKRPAAHDARAKPALVTEGERRRVRPQPQKKQERLRAH
jgi:hypothetical protein